jgi:hypothetical protein
VGILKGLNYDRNIVQFYGACIREGADPMLVTEFMEGAHILKNTSVYINGSNLHGVMPIGWCRHLC